MKRISSTLLTLLACASLQALPVGNPSDASLLCDGLFWAGHCGDLCDPHVSWVEAISFRFGFYGDYVFNRHMRNREIASIIDQTTLTTNAGLIVLNAWDRIDLFTTLGATHFGLQTSASTFGSFATDVSLLEIHSNSHFSWSAGARATIWECGCTTFGLEGQYFRSCPEFDHLSINGSTSFTATPVNICYQEWQVGVGISHRMNIFVPYIALTWSGAKANFDNGSMVRFFSLKNDKLWGYAVGVSLVDCEKMSLTAEGRFADVRAFSMNGQIRF